MSELVPVRAGVERLSRGAPDVAAMGVQADAGDDVDEIYEEPRTLTAREWHRQPVALTTVNLSPAVHSPRALRPSLSSPGQLPGAGTEAAASRAGGTAAVPPETTEPPLPIEVHACPPSRSTEDNVADLWTSRSARLVHEASLRDAVRNRPAIGRPRSMSAKPEDVERDPRRTLHAVVSAPSLACHFSSPRDGAPIELSLYSRLRDRADVERIATHHSSGGTEHSTPREHTPIPVVRTHRDSPGRIGSRTGSRASRKPTPYANLVTRPPSSLIFESDPVLQPDTPVHCDPAPAETPHEPASLPWVSPWERTAAQNRARVHTDYGYSHTQSCDLEEQTHGGHANTANALVFDGDASSTSSGWNNSPSADTGYKSAFSPNANVPRSTPGSAHGRSDVSWMRRHFPSLRFPWRGRAKRLRAQFSHDSARSSLYDHPIVLSHEHAPSALRGRSREARSAIHVNDAAGFASRISDTTSRPYAPTACGRTAEARTGDGRVVAHQVRTVEYERILNTASLGRLDHAHAGRQQSVASSRPRAFPSRTERLTSSGRFPSSATGAARVMLPRSNKFIYSPNRGDTSSDSSAPNADECQEDSFYVHMQSTARRPRHRVSVRGTRRGQRDRPIASLRRILSSTR